MAVKEAGNSTKGWQRLVIMKTSRPYPVRRREDVELRSASIGLSNPRDNHSTYKYFFQNLTE